MLDRTPQLSFAKATDSFAMYYNYILYSEKADLLYYGYTTDLKKRLTSHNNGENFATKPYLPWKILWYCAFPTDKQAKAFELYLKSGSGKAFTRKRLVALAKDKMETMTPQVSEARRAKAT
ncbi:MAG: GIY-YIG nuclease family protein [bacterium]